MKTKTTSAAFPRKSAPYTVEKMNGIDNWFIGGLDGYTSFHDENDAKLVADALNFSREYKKVLKKAEYMYAELREFTGKYE